MASRKQIWFYRGSPAAKLVQPLRRQYKLHPIAAPSRGSQGKIRASSKLSSGVVCLVDLDRDPLEPLRDFARAHPGVRIIGVTGDSRKRLEAVNGTREGRLFACLPRKAPLSLVERTVAAAFETIELTRREQQAREELARTEREMEELNQIGVALSATRDINELLRLILQKAREITRADAGSLYLVEETEEGKERKAEERSYVHAKLRFKLTQNDSRQFPFTEFTMPITERSIAGYVALHGEVVNLPDAYKIGEGRPFQFNPKIDQETGYRTRSMLTLPMRNAKGETLGVLQLINCKRDFRSRLTSAATVTREVVAFSPRAARMALSLASQAAVAYENSKLYEDIETLFEGFVKAAVTAIEQRDPTTSGHSFRVSTLTVGLAETVDRVDSGPYAGINFTREEMKEIRYAALLHDFGKVGVREEVLVKAKKLYPAQLELVSQRFEYVRKELEARTSQQKLQYLLESSREEALQKIGLLDEEYKRQLAEVDDYYQFVLQVNEPTVLPEGKFDRLIEIAKNTYRDTRGMEHNLLRPDEVRFLSIPKGSLDADERLQIESHVIHTFNFLNQIPWTKEIRGIPMIARAHHEKLNGRGYPYKLKSEEIPVQSKMMTICDIFDALSASDRPYKKALPVDRALNILEMSVRDTEVDPVLFQLFLDAKIFQLTTRR